MTSGTTGKPLLWMLTETDVQRLALNERLSFECAGRTAGDTVLVAVAMGRGFMAVLREALQARAKITPQVRHAALAEIEAWQLPAPAWKRRTFVDLR